MTDKEKGPGEANRKRLQDFLERRNNPKIKREFEKATLKKQKRKKKK